MPISHIFDYTSGYTLVQSSCWHWWHVYSTIGYRLPTQYKPLSYIKSLNFCFIYLFFTFLLFFTLFYFFLLFLNGVFKRLGVEGSVGCMSRIITNPFQIEHPFQLLSVSRGISAKQIRRVLPEWIINSALLVDTASQTDETNDDFIDVLEDLKASLEEDGLTNRFDMDLDEDTMQALQKLLGKSYVNVMMSNLELTNKGLFCVIEHGLRMYSPNPS